MNFFNTSLMSGADRCRIFAFCLSLSFPRLFDENAHDCTWTDAIDDIIDVYVVFTAGDHTPDTSDGDEAVGRVAAANALMILHDRDMLIEERTRCNDMIC